MITRISMGLETCQILGQDSHNLLYWKKNLPTDICGPGRRLTRKQLTSRPDHVWPELWKSMGKHAKLKEKQNWSNEKFHFENARKLRGIYFIDPEDKEFTETIKNARKKLETSVAPAMPCKIMKNCGSDVSNKIFFFFKKKKQNLRAFWKLMNWEIRYRIIINTILQEKETIHYSITIWYTNSLNRLSQYHFGAQLDLCIFGALPPIQHFSDDICPSVRQNEL